MVDVAIPSRKSRSYVWDCCGRRRSIDVKSKVVYPLQASVWGLKEPDRTQPNSSREFLCRASDSSQAEVPCVIAHGRDAGIPLPWAFISASASKWFVPDSVVSNRKITLAGRIADDSLHDWRTRLPGSCGLVFTVGVLDTVIGANLLNTIAFLPWCSFINKHRKQAPRQVSVA